MLSAATMTVRTGHRNDRIEVARCQRVAQVSKIIGEKCLHESEISAKRRLDQIGPSVHLHSFLAILDRCSQPGLREDAAETKSARSYPLDQSSLRDQFHLETTGHHLPLRFRIETDVTDNHLAQ